ncbi:hypothetical protein AVL62_13345 [Serinicoccus chungangensis]|uniref:DUF2087 domain-containing protein n=2 Tax=Serinicoccus chungangensis TaxID=767452 RepID=A0A0W8IC14_9MICO|nr:hypothetical protein AVL62_13345 [Serinicoccus chungangensis]
MTTDADLKARVRERMTRTGETYTAAREALLAQPPPPRAPRADTEPPPPRAPRADTEPPPPRALVVETDLAADRAVAIFVDGDRLRSIPTRRRPRAAVLMHLLLRFERGREYAEREVNALLATAHEDVASLRRELVDYRWLQRADGVYRVADELPERFPAEAQEVPTDEVARFARVPRHRD